jgi:FKBP-type peptidyl-prolyl cis-trans isomerase FkpA
MAKRILLLAFAFLALSPVFAQKDAKKSPKTGSGKAEDSGSKDALCPNPSRKGLKSLITTDGLEYYFFKRDANGKKARLGDIITMHITYKNHKDSVVGTTHQMGAPMPKKAEVPPYKGSLEDGLFMVSPGDSVVFFVPVDSVLKQVPKQHWPPFVIAGTKLAFEISVVDINTEEELKQKEKQELLDFAKKSGYNPIVTPSGLVYAITQQGTGAQAQPGDQVTVHYTGKLLDGKKFDSSVDRGTPFDFKLGAHQVIQGWDEGIALLKEGTKAVLIIPARLGYGERGSPPTIPPNAPLCFDVELIKTKAPEPPKAEEPAKLEPSPAKETPAEPKGKKKK